MKEDLLQFIWHRQLFKGQLQIEDGSNVEVIHPGELNHLSGPDFSNAKVAIDGILWVGNVEIHVKESDWFHHGHQEDPAYKKIILHVICDPGFSSSRTGHPTLNLYNHINEKLISSYESLMNKLSSLPCETHLSMMDSSKRKLWLSAMGLERFSQKVSSFKKGFHNSGNDLDHLLMSLLFRAFGFAVNQEGFDQLAARLHPNVFYRLSEDPEKIRILLFGMASLELPPGEKDQLRVLLKRFRLVPIRAEFWKRGALRPGNRIEVRLSQLSYILKTFQKLRSAIHLGRPAVELEAFIRPNSNAGQNPIGQASIDGIFINAIAPYVFIYSEISGSENLKSYAVELLESRKAETNKYTKLFSENGLKAQSSLDSQAMIHLFRNYCRPKKCLNCAIGNDLILSHDRKDKRIL
jgi:hypothetical protein